jgi:protein-S-isoprenylcysteine O-methyltransferase Ste14
MSSLKNYVKANWQRLLDIYFFINFILWAGWNFYIPIRGHQVNFLEVSFLIQNLVLAVLFMVRRPYYSIDKNYFHQLVALTAFFSGILLLGNTRTTNSILLNTSTGIILLSNILGILTLVNLGKSFGVLISFRKVQSKGLYSVVRHPMYLTDILLRIGFIISHFSLFALVVFVVSTACYIYRAILEERFLKQKPEYAAYMEKVKYRFIPYIF